jgi:hypothetical protein
MAFPLDVLCHFFFVRVQTTDGVHHSDYAGSGMQVPEYVPLALGTITLCRWLSPALLLSVAWQSWP